MKPRFVILFALLVVPALVVLGCGNDTTFSPDTTPPLAPVLQGANMDAGMVAVWWQPNAESDLNGYYVYLEEDGVTTLSNRRPLSNAYAVIPVTGNSVRVYVTAVDISGNESSPSASARPTLVQEAQVHTGQNDLTDF